MNVSHNEHLFQRAQAVIPGGVNSPVRAFKAVGGTPRFIAKAQGAYMWDADGQRYIDYIGSWGPMILGHGHPEVVAAVQAALGDGFSYGAPTQREVELAEEIIKLFPSVEQVRLVSSGTEAGMSAIRLARGYTGRKSIIKFEGCYHGHADALLVKAGSGLATFGHPTSSGVPPEVVQHTLVLEYNNVPQLEAAFAAHGADIACLMVEPIAGNMNFIRSSPEFVSAMRRLCSEHGALLVYDEVMTGLRVGLGSTQGLHGVRPDITVMGKVIGGGMPLAAFGASKEIMSHLAPLGGVYQAGTLSGNPIATACGLATLKLLQAPNFYEHLALCTRSLVQGLVGAAQSAGVTLCGDSEGGMFGFYFNEALPQNYQQMMGKGTQTFNQFFHLMLEQGVYFAPAMYEAGFVSSAHTAQDIDDTVQAARLAFSRL
jgi:glutamate-1-semialdehyde 2,1-aminomutase